MVIRSIKSNGPAQSSAGVSSRELAVQSFTQIVLPRLAIVSTLMRGLSPAGRLVWEQYQQVCRTFSDARQRLQFLSAGPERYYELNRLAQVPERLIARFGLSKQDFLDFMGFASLCGLERRFGKKLELERLLQQEGLPAEMAEAYKKIEVELKNELANPIIPRAGQFNKWVGVFRSLLQAVSSPNVFLAFGYPTFIWITQNTLPPRFAPNFSDSGKWIINSRDPQELITLAKKLLPYCAIQDLGTIKFEIFPRSNGLCFAAVYCREKDPQVEQLVKNNAGKAPFWCYDEYCYDADALTTLLQTYMLQQTIRFCTYKDIPQSQAEELLKRSAEIGLSSFQVEILYTLLDAERTAKVKPDSALGHILSTYFINVFDTLRETTEEEVVHDYVKMFVCTMFDKENLKAARAFLAKHKQSVLSIYSRGRQ